MMNWLPWILVVAMGYEVQCQAYSDRKNRGDGPRGIHSLFFSFFVFFFFFFFIFELRRNTWAVREVRGIWS